MVKFKPPFKPGDVVYEITVADILEVAESLSIPGEKVTDAVISTVQSRLDSALEGWSDVVEDALRESLISFSLN